jgi:hypothetical protein
VLLDSGLDGTAGLSDVDLTTLARHAVHARNLESQVVLHRPKETGVLVWGLPHRLDILPEQQPSDAVESRAHTGQEGNRDRFLRDWCTSSRWIEGPSGLLIAVAILPESGLQKLQSTM